ncbi:MAG TPA: fibronectin type III domain-containing protein [Thermoanaerobaculia bacterium]|nr:fibronectin type III domain-containing protein [Thermoanaerobaculia bacterium]
MYKKLACVLAFVASGAAAAIPSAQRDALIAIHNATGGASWNDRSGWLGAAGTECSWHGVRCDEQQTAVVELELYDNNLNGTLPSSIGAFPSLQVLLLFDNFLTGPLPDTIGQLSNLEVLILDRNEFTGPIPPAIGQLTKLKLFNLDGNRFTSIPGEIGNLQALEEIDFSYNELAGPIPAEIGQLANLVDLQLSVNLLSDEIPRSIGNLAKLERLGLAENMLTGTIPSELGALTALISLYLPYNFLEGTIPAALGSLRNLEELELGQNRLSGPIPPELTGLTALRRLHLFTNDLDGQLPPALFGMTALEELGLSDNLLSGPIPPQFANLTALTYLSLGYNSFTGSIPPEIGALTRLQTFEVAGNDLTGSIPPELGQLKDLYWLDLASNELSGPIPSSLGSLPQLGFLSMYENQIEGPIPPELGNLSQLETLYLTSNRLSGTIPESLRNLTRLRAFFLGGNRLTGEIPPWIGELTQLDTIFFPGNQFTGVIPPSIGQLVNLESLYLGENRLTGSIPREIGNLSRLGYLSLEYNEISGPIPPEFWNLAELVEIRLNDMALSGTLPAAIGNLRKADVLLLSNNQIEGTIPPEIGNLESLLYLSLGANAFTGPIPREIGRLSNLVQIDLYANALRGEIPPEIAEMTSLEDNGSDFHFNALTAPDPATRDFINRKQWDGDFEATQTLTPANVRVTQTTDRGATVEWDLIRYAYDPGGYQVTATNAAGFTVTIATTRSKETGSIIVRGLEASTQYLFRVSAVTHPHDFQKNLLVSDPSPAVSTTTGVRVVAPADVALTEAPTGLVQIDGAAVNEDGFTLTNFGDTSTTITLVKEETFFTMEPESFPLAGGASRRVVLRSVPQPPGSYYGFIDPAGEGVSDDLFIYPTLLSAARPAGTVIAEALSTRIEVAGAPGLDTVGQARFRNIGTAPLSGIVLSDQPWVVPAPDPITIHPSEVGTVNFTVARSRRPPESAGALSANLSLVYVDGSVNGARVPSPTSLIDPALTNTAGVSVTLVTVVDISKPPVAPGQPPGIAGGEVVWFAPGIASVARSFGRFVTDVSILNAASVRSISDLKIYFTPAGAQSSSVATMGAITPAQAVTLANIVTNIYEAESAVGSLQFRSTSWQSLAPAARLISATDRGTHSGSLPIFRSDRSVGPGQQTYLAGLREGNGFDTALYLQETSGAPASVRIELLDAGGGAAAPLLDLALDPFGMAEILDALPPSAVTAIVTNVTGSSGRIVAYARVADEASGDTWSITDWSRLHRFTMGEAVRIPFVDGAGAVTGGGRRRAVSHSDGARSRTEVTIFNPGPTELRARLQVIDAAGRASSREIAAAPRQTITVSDAGSGATSSSASAVLTPLAGAQLVVSARSHRTTTGTQGTAIPVLPAAAGLRLGQSQRFPALSDSTAATVAASRPGTFRSAFGFVETSGRSATVRARLYLDGGRDLVSAVIYRDYELGPLQQLLAGDLVRSIVGPSRETALGELHGIQLHAEVVGGSGAVIPFVLVTDNGTGDTILRLD